MWSWPLLFLVASSWSFLVEAKSKGEKHVDDEDSSSHHYLRLGKRQAVGTGKKDAAPPFLRDEYGGGGLKRNRPQLKKASVTILFHAIC